MAFEQGAGDPTGGCRKVGRLPVEGCEDMPRSVGECRGRRQSRAPGVLGAAEQGALLLRPLYALTQCFVAAGLC